MRVVGLVALVVAAVAAGVASASSQATRVIRPGQAIGPIRLGMSQSELQRAMGTPRVVMRRAAGFGTRTVDYEFGYADYTVRLFGAPRRLRVIRVKTLLRRERTSRGIGPHSWERDLIRAYPRVRCGRLPTIVAVGTVYVTADERTCTLFTGSGRRTTFVTGVPRSGILIRLRDWPRRARVLEVGVAAGG